MALTSDLTRTAKQQAASMNQMCHVSGNKVNACRFCTVSVCVCASLAQSVCKYMLTSVYTVNTYLRVHVSA